MSWASLRDAMVAAVQTASGLDAQHIIWADQSATQPTGSYISLSLSSAENPGQDGVVESTDLTRPTGQEVQIAVVGFREVVLQLEIFTDAVVSSGSAADALDLAETIRSALRLPTVRETAAAVGLSFLDLAAPVQYVPTVVAVGFRGRATLDLHCNVPATDAAEYAGYIAEVDGTMTVHGGNVDPRSTVFTAP